MSKLKIAVIGMAVMGRNLALNMTDHGYDVAIYNRSKEPVKRALEEDKLARLHAFDTLEELVAALEKPRRIVLMIKAGEPVDIMIEKLLPLLDENDIIIDAGNSYFKDSRRRGEALKENKINFLGVGVSGGEDGARFGPAIMPGGNREAYEKVREIFENIAAKAEDGSPCCYYVSEDGSGHYVKMVHNGIEYADMQIITEAYTILKHRGGYNNEEIADIFDRYNQGALNSYLIEITSKVLREKDPEKPGYLLDNIKDITLQKGTGLWTNREAVDLGVESSILLAGLNARVISALKDERVKASEIYGSEEPMQLKDDDKDEMIKDLEAAMYAAKLMAYAQGFALMRAAAEEYGWQLDYSQIAAGFRNGCIIRARLLQNIMDAFSADPDAVNLILTDAFSPEIKKAASGLRSTVLRSVKQGLPVPAMSASLAYFDAYRRADSGANLTQALRDYFGAHGIERIEGGESFHHQWS